MQTYVPIRECGSAGLVHASASLDPVPNRQTETDERGTKAHMAAMRPASKFLLRGHNKAYFGAHPRGYVAELALVRSS